MLALPLLYDQQMPDSSAVYAGYVRCAWRQADPEVKAQLVALEGR